MGRSREAITAYKRAVEIDPGFLQAHLNLTVSYLQSQQYGLAIKHYDQAEKLGLSDPGLAQSLAPHRK